MDTENICLPAWRIYWYFLFYAFISFSRFISLLVLLPSDFRIWHMTGSSSALLLDNFVVLLDYCCLDLSSASKQSKVLFNPKYWRYSLTYLLISALSGMLLLLIFFFLLVINNNTLVLIFLYWLIWLCIYQ